MTPSRIEPTLAVFAVFCVLALFFFPSMEGPYSAVHGPVTALLSLRAALRLRGMIRGGVRAARMWFARVLLALTALRIRSDFPVASPSNLAAACASVLRC